MSIKLDWDIEADRGKQREHGEDLAQRRRRHMGLFRLFLVIALFLLVVGVIGWVVWQRWNQVNSRIEQLLRETVQAEIAALRIGDAETYLDIQRSATNDWLIQQQALYDTYQQQKVTSDISLTGQIIELEIDGQRGRVKIEEIINDVPFVRMWFYWRYDDGWRHVPADFTFWGEPARIERPYFVVRYRSVDEAVAMGLADNATRWFTDACTYLDCTNLPAITFDIVTDPLPQAYWAANEQDAWQMVLPSPFIEQARADMPFDQYMQVDAATLLANRLVDHTTNDLEPMYPFDSYFLHSSIVAWMVGRFVQVNPESHLVESIATNYGMDTVGRLLREMQPGSHIGMLASTLGVSSLADANLDWRDFIEWRLKTEQELIERGDEASWLNFYTFPDESVRQSAYARYNANGPAKTFHVLETNLEAGSDGTQQLVARYEIIEASQTQEQLAFFQLVNGKWLRAS